MWRLVVTLATGAFAAVLGCDLGSTSSAQPTSGDVTIVLGTPTDGGVSAPITVENGGAFGNAAGAAIRIPAGALKVDTTIGLSESSRPLLPSMHPLTPAYDFSPTDLSVLLPVTITLPLPEGTANAVIYLSRLDGSGWDLVGGAIWDGSIKAQVMHLGTAFAGEPITVR